jgi:uncharacterized protein
MVKVNGFAGVGLRRAVWIAVVWLGAVVMACAQDKCEFGTPGAGDTLAKALEKAGSCRVAAAKLNDCAWGSSADTTFADIVIHKCEGEFLAKLSPVAKQRYGDEMQLCAYEYGRQDGTMYISAAALCQAAVAAGLAENPAMDNQPMPRATFDCARAQTKLEIAICSDVGLGHADIILGRVYRGVLRNASGAARAALIESERQWLQRVPELCGLSGTPLSRGAVDCVRNEFEQRFTALDGCFDFLPDCLRGLDSVADESAAVNPQPRASFDCEAPSTGLEIVICADADLGKKDIQLASAYRDAGRKMAPSEHGTLVASERRWLRFINASCPFGPVGGVPSIFARGCVSSAFDVRIGQLQACPQQPPAERMQCLNDFHLMDEKK